MNVSLPFSRKKRYLTGSDWIITALDYMSKKATGIGNASQIVLELQDVFPIDRFREAFTSFARLFPILRGYSSRDMTLAPYW